MSVPFTRRSLLKGSGALATASFVGTLGALHARRAQAAGRQQAPVASPYGPVAPVADQSTGLPLLELPAGFSYTSYGWTNDPLADGRPTPGNHDGMAVVSTRRVGRGLESALIRNHELGLVATAAEQIQAPRMYATGRVDGVITLTGALTVRIGIANGSLVTQPPLSTTPPPFQGFPGGGTTTLTFRDGRWTGARANLGGTLGNCAGGPTPWGSWLTCEETIFDFSAIGGARHGYVFETATDPMQSDPVPIVAMGRFVHEAVAVDPATGIVYETEDNRNAAALYRFVPNVRPAAVGDLRAQGGRLQAARIAGLVRQAVPSASLAAANNLALLSPEIDDEYQLEWVDIDNPDADPRSAVGLPGGIQLAAIAGPTLEALGKGCARMSRGEGIWHAAGKMYIVDTGAGFDGRGRPGQGEGCVWELDLASMRLKAIYVSGNDLAGNNPDNITVSPRGGLVLCEDGGDGSAGGARLLGLTGGGEAYVFCRSIVELAQNAAGKTVAAGDYSGREFAGACFDPSGRVLFVNNYVPGITFAITGPWGRGNL